MTEKRIIALNEKVYEWFHFSLAANALFRFRSERCRNHLLHGTFLQQAYFRTVGWTIKPAGGLPEESVTFPLPSSKCKHNSRHPLLFMLWDGGGWQHTPEEFNYLLAAQAASQGVRCASSTSTRTFTPRTPGIPEGVSVLLRPSSSRTLEKKEGKKHWWHAQYFRCGHLTVILLLALDWSYIDPHKPKNLQEKIKTLNKMTF